MLRLSNIRIGIKLAMMSLIAILLVAGISIIQRLNGDAVVVQNFQEDLAQSVRSKLKDTQALILRTWIARRDGLLSESIADVDKSISALHASIALVQDKIHTVAKSLVAPEDRERLKEIKSVFSEYAESAEAQVNAQKDLLALRQRQIDALAASDKGYSAVAGSPEFANPDIEGDIRDGVFAMKDAATAFWRYSAASEDEFAANMHAAAAKATASFNHAKGIGTDAGFKSGVDGLLAVMTELNAVMDGSKKINDLKNQLEHDRTEPARAKLDEIIPKSQDAALKAADVAGAAVDAAITSSERAGVIGGGFVVLILIGSAVFGNLSIARPLRRIAGVLGELTHDRIVAVPYTGRGDEIGGIAKATEVFKETIAGKVINLRIRTALDVSRSNVMLVDANYDIIYMNGTLLEMLRAAESEIRKA